jgi:hypothetical protein
VDGTVYDQGPHNLLADGLIFESFCENEGDRIHRESGNGKSTNL